ncbi:Hypothetical protein R9X50_00380400 [Acrodontium crateriforme]|uniref:Uncharacterized protein n=1 Tax=Acrodontium crateriforme TaxID=150365 RepID=A0AAQ3M446_9PEZI|nr:Hypothetical protein R9X50_00380400 [Acrodontium crateriforme]
MAVVRLLSRTWPKQNLLFYHSRHIAPSTKPPSECNNVRTFEDVMNYYGIQKWGFVIYRGTYDDDVKWRQFIDFMALRTRHELEASGGAHLASKFDWNVQEDRSLEGATTSEIRERFKNWVAANAADEILPIGKSRGRDPLARSPYDVNARFNFCMYVDSASMNSVLRDREVYNSRYTMEHGGGYVILIERAWKIPSLEELDDEREDPWDEGEKELEGSKLYEVGWTKVRSCNAVPLIFFQLCNVGGWELIYLRPCMGIQEFT